MDGNGVGWSDKEKSFMEMTFELPCGKRFHFASDLVYFSQW